MFVRLQLAVQPPFVENIILLFSLYMSRQFTTFTTSCKLLKGDIELWEKPRPSSTLHETKEQIQALLHFASYQIREHDATPGSMAYDEFDDIVDSILGVILPNVSGLASASLYPKRHGFSLISRKGISQLKALHATIALPSRSTDTVSTIT